MQLPKDLWNQSIDENPDDREAARLRYVELLTTEGYVIGPDEGRIPPGKVNKETGRIGD